MSSSNPVAKSCTSFSLSVLKQLTENGDCTGKNILYSPVSISSALAMVMVGARGNTAAQMAQSLWLQNIQGDVHADFSKLMSDLKKTGASFTLSMANRLYGEQSFKFDGAFVDAAKKQYNTSAMSVDFKGKAEATRVDINRWVAQETKDKVKELLAAGVVDETTSLLLVNAIYFKGMWDKPFKEASIGDAQFRINETESKPVRMMYKNSTYPLNVISELNCQILELPYAGRHMSMIIFLPIGMPEGNATGLEKLEKAMGYKNFVHWTNPRAMGEKKVQLGLPQFKMEQTCDMTQVLTNIGMVDAFDATKSDFSGMSPAKYCLGLSKLVHKAVVEVTAEGTKPPSGASKKYGSDTSEMTPFVADHPFLFFIRHNPSLSILMAGRYCSPP